MKEVMTVAGILVLSIVGAYLVFLFTRYVVLVWVRRFARKTKIKFDDVIVKNKVFDSLNYFLPALVMYFVFSSKYSDVGLNKFEKIFYVLMIKASKIAIGFSIALALGRLLDALLEIYNSRPIAKRWPMRGYVQLAKVIIWGSFLLVSFGVVFNVSVLTVLSGIGALSAVLMLVFRTTLLSFFASFQVIAQDLIRIGDWIEMPKYGADGEVTDLTVHSLVVRNWDKTYIVIPTYKLLEDSFKNWRGMKSARARRMKKSLYVTTTSIKSIDRYEVEKALEKIFYNENFIKEAKKLLEVEKETNNLTLYRKFLNLYISTHPKVSPRYTHMVRYINCTPTGVEVEIYCFLKTTEWIEYEQIQASILEDAFELAQALKLEVFSFPADYSFRKREVERSGSV